MVLEELVEKEKKGLFVLLSPWALLPALKKKKAKTPFPSTFHSLAMSTEVSWPALPSALSPPQLSAHSLPSAAKAKHTSNPN